MNKRLALTAHKVTHHAHLVTHVAYLGLVFVHSPYYPFAAGTLCIVVVFGEVIERKLKRVDNEH